MKRPPHVVGIGGTPRDGSYTEKALRLCLSAAGREGAEITVVSGPGLLLPLYSPDVGERSPEARRLVELLRSADGIVIASPGYHGSISGVVKNAIDYVEDLRSDENNVYLEGRAVGCIACAAGWQAANSTLTALRSIAHALRGWPTPMGAAINTATRIFDEEGNCVDAYALAQLEIIAKQVVGFANQHVRGRKIIPSDSFADRVQPLEI